MSRVIDDAFGGKGLTTVPFDLAPKDVAVFSGKKFRKPSRIAANLRCSAEGNSFVGVEGTSRDGCEDRQKNRYRSRTCSRSGGGSSTTR
jgi:hypothetical protein